MTKIGKRRAAARTQSWLRDGAAPLVPAESENRPLVACSPDGVESVRVNPGDDAKVDEFEVVAARSRVATRVRVGQSIAKALRSAGVVVPSSCGEGICGTCETRVLGGTPDHRDSFLTEDERAAGTTMLVCVSGCKSNQLVLDL
jgi:ferredoxin